MNVTLDANVLLRAVLADDLEQQRIASSILVESDVVVVPVVALCEFARVLTQRYKKPASEVAGSIRTLLASGKVRADRPAVEAGLAMLDQGDDFADGVIAFDGSRLGGAMFASFDRTAVKLVRRAGQTARAL